MEGSRIFRTTSQLDRYNAALPLPFPQLYVRPQPRFFDRMLPPGARMLMATRFDSSHPGFTYSPSWPTQQAQVQQRLPSFCEFSGVSIDKKPAASSPSFGLSGDQYRSPAPFDTTHFCAVCNHPCECYTSLCIHMQSAEHQENLRIKYFGSSSSVCSQDTIEHPRTASANIAKKDTLIQQAQPASSCTSSPVFSLPDFYCGEAFKVISSHEQDCRLQYQIELMRAKVKEISKCFSIVSKSCARIFGVAPAFSRMKILSDKQPKFAPETVAQGELEVLKSCIVELSQFLKTRPSLVRSSTCHQATQLPEFVPKNTEERVPKSKIPIPNPTTGSRERIGSTDLDESQRSPKTMLATKRPTSTQLGEDTHAYPSSNVANLLTLSDKNNFSPRHRDLAETPPFKKLRTSDSYTITNTDANKQSNSTGNIPVLVEQKVAGFWGVGVKSGGTAGTGSEITNKNTSTKSPGSISATSSDDNSGKASSVLCNEKANEVRTSSDENMLLDILARCKQLEAENKALWQAYIKQANYVALASWLSDFEAKLWKDFP